MGLRPPAVESLVMGTGFWPGRRVLVTGHTGFKGAWLTLWLRLLGARVAGLALAPDSRPSLFEAAEVGTACERSVLADIRDPAAVDAVFQAFRPEIVLHLAAQSLVRRSYARPVDTYGTNVMGTVHVLDAARRQPEVGAVLIVTSDKCYENREWPWGYRESDRLGGRDPYASSKACTELVTAAYRASFFDGAGRAAVASARAGNVIGGGDWSEDRLVPDLIRAFAAGQPALIRHPDAVRPWQHVLEPLAGYLLLAERLAGSDSAGAEAWNFGPEDADARPVSALADALAQHWGAGATWRRDPAVHPHEAAVLRLDSTKARQRLGWRPRLPLDRAIDWTAAWYRACHAEPQAARRITEAQIRDYAGLAADA